MNKPEVLSPAGDMERLQAALRLAQTAVYLAGTEFGMRSAPANFTEEELAAAVTAAHAQGVRVYLTCNTIPRNAELERLGPFLSFAQDAGVDAFIMTDFGVMELAKRFAPHVDIHISTQAGVANYAAANAFYRMGASRVVLARELTLEEIAGIRTHTPKELELEAFVHGAMCMSFSGRCLLSNYMTGRDANHGDCAQPCRWKYALVEEKRPGQYFPVEETQGGSFILNSRDLCMIRQIPDMIEAGVTSLKIEGRAKSAYYVSVITNAYRLAVGLVHGTPWSACAAMDCGGNRKISHRPYSTGFYLGGDRARKRCTAGISATEKCLPFARTGRRTFDPFPAQSLFPRRNSGCPGTWQTAIQSAS